MYEAAHGTVTRHYYAHLKGENTTTNPIATLFAWTGALKKRGQLDGLSDLVAFSEKLEKESLALLEEGVVPDKVLGGLLEVENVQIVNTESYLKMLAARLL